MRETHKEDALKTTTNEPTSREPKSKDEENFNENEDEDEARHTTDLRHVRCWNETRPQRTCSFASLEQLKQWPLSMYVCWCALVCVLVLVSVRQFVCFVKVELG